MRRTHAMSDFDAAVTAPFRMQPGLRRVADDAPLLTPTRPGSPHLVEKLGVLARHADQALLRQTGLDATDLRRGLAAEACRGHPDAFAGDGDSLTARALGWSVAGTEVRGDGADAIGAVLRGLHPEWRLTALLCLAVEEDLALLEGDTTRVPWLAVCLPSSWAPETKLGLRFAEIHAPVADNDRLLAASEHLVRLVTGGERRERFVWTLTPRPMLDAHPQRVGAACWSDAVDPDALAAQAFVRIERQRFIPLAAPARQAIFTIRVALRPLIDTVDSAERAGRLHAALASMSDAVLAYRGLAPARDRLLAWLAARAG